MKQSAGLLIGRKEKVKFCCIFRDKFTEKTADLVGNLLEFFWVTIFAEKQPVKNSGFGGNFLAKFCWKAISFSLI